LIAAGLHLVAEFDLQRLPAKVSSAPVMRCLLGLSYFPALNSFSARQLRELMLTEQSRKKTQNLGEGKKIAT
jgi:hypothetical protein